MADTSWQTFWTAVGALATASAVVVTLLVTNDGRPAPATPSEPLNQAAKEGGDAPRVSDPYALSLLRVDVAVSAQRARQAQAQAQVGAARAREAAARAQEAERRAASGDARFQIVDRDPEWRGERLSPGAVVFGVLRRGDDSATGEFRFEERVETDSAGFSARRARFLPLRHIATSSRGRFEGAASGVDQQWSGPGRYEFANGDVFEGIWLPNADVTYGVLTYANGQRFEGAFEDLQQQGFDMQRHGLGVLWTAEGRVSREGRWVHGTYAE